MGLLLVLLLLRTLVVLDSWAVGSCVGLTDGVHNGLVMERRKLLRKVGAMGVGGSGTERSEGGRCVRAKDKDKKKSVEKRQKSGTQGLCKVEAKGVAGQMRREKEKKRKGKKKSWALGLGWVSRYAARQ